MENLVLPAGIKQQIDRCIACYMSNQREFEALAKVVLVNLSETKGLADLVHSTKMRTKDPDHLRDKLQRKVRRFGRKVLLDINDGNLFSQIDDLAGVRLLHLHTRQMERIHPAILDVLREHRYTLVRKPEANTWDTENMNFFKGLGLKTVFKPSMYTSVHYVVKANRRTDMRCEIQVRTLMEEVWGEVSHKINYPHESESIACTEQLKALARLASGCTRLVDSIFASFSEYRQGMKQGRKKRPRKA